MGKVNILVYFGDVMVFKEKDREWVWENLGLVDLWGWWVRGLVLLVIVEDWSKKVKLVW